jgi:apolipoprotein N-acyltransferase
LSSIGRAKTRCASKTRRATTAHRTRPQNKSVSFWRSFRQPARYAVLLAGALPVLAFPATNLEFLAWVVLVPGLALMRAAPTRREAAVRGWWFGAGYLLAEMYWLAPNLGPGLLLVAVVLGFLWSAVGMATWSLLQPPVTSRRALAALAVVPSCWLVTEWIRSWQGIGGPWAVFGASQWQHPAVLALAAVGGIWLVSFALVAANTGLLIALVARVPLVRLVGLAGALVAIGAGPLAFAGTAPAPVARQLTIALVQPGVLAGPAIRVQREEMLTEGAAGRADLFVWGESSVGYDLSDHPALLASIEKVAATSGAEILANQDALNAAGAKSKQATLISSAGIAGRYVKTRLVPFGEYIPFRPVLGWLSKISRAAAQNVVPGTGAHVLRARLPGGTSLTFGPLICFESAFPDMSRVDADHGAQVIIYQTSDSTFQASWAPAQHAALGAVRAAETGRPVVQAALTGDSAAFDARGRTLAFVGSSYRGVILVHLDLPLASARTAYDRLGDYVPWTAVGIAALAGLIGIGRGRMARRKSGGAAAGGPAEVRTDSQLSG